MSEEQLRPLTQEHGEDGTITSSTCLSPTDNNTRGMMCVRPTTVVPVIFVPGIMGSNLRDKQTGDSIWNVDSKVAIIFQWIFRSARTRQAKLVPDRAEVDNRGSWFGQSATVSDENVAKLRGQGTTSRASYGDFVRWLDDQLNGEVVKGKATHHTNTEHCGLASPWQSFVDGKYKDETWHAEKLPFERLTLDESEYAWGNFFCPVHVQGYNWLQSNGKSGEALAQTIKDIIKYWNEQTVCGYRCEQVILVSHSMGGLATRAVVHAAYGNMADKVLGIVHGEQPANGAAAAYHHCRNGYGGMDGLVLGRNAAQVTAVFANAPGAMELLPNQQYNDQGSPAERRWLKVRLGGQATPILQLPESDPYKDIYLQKDAWWRLTDPNLIDPCGKRKDVWTTYAKDMKDVGVFHRTLGVYYHPQTYVHYGADDDKHAAYGDLIWRGNGSSKLSQAELFEAPPKDGSNPVQVASLLDGTTETFSIVAPKAVGYPQPGDGTVPACSGEAPYRQGSNNVQQSFRLSGFEHQAAYDNEDVRFCTLYAIGKLLRRANVL